MSKKFRFLGFVCGFIGLIFITPLLLGLFLNLSTATKILPSVNFSSSNGFSLDVNPMFNGYSSLSPQPVHFIMADQDFWIPKYYIDSVSQSNSIEQRGILLFANLPDLTPTLEEKKDIHAAFKNLYKFVSLHIQDAKKFPRTFPNLYLLYRSYQPHWESQNDKYGLHLEIPKNSITPLSNAELYTEQNEKGGMRSYLECNFDGSVPNPGCTHHFEYKNLLVDFHFNKIYLPQWKEMQGKAISLIDSFSKPPLKGTPI